MSFSVRWAWSLLCALTMLPAGAYAAGGEAAVLPQRQAVPVRVKNRTQAGFEKQKAETFRDVHVHVNTAGSGAPEDLVAALEQNDVTIAVAMPTPVPLVSYDPDATLSLQLVYFSMAARADCVFLRRRRVAAAVTCGRTADVFYLR